MTPNLYYCIAAYNEEDNIGKCLDSLVEQEFVGDLETIICLNGCTDKTQSKVEEAKQKYSQLNISAIHSAKGLAFAQNAIVDYVRNRNVPLLFADADVTLDTKCVDILYDELRRVEQLIVVGSWPVPEKPVNMNLWEKFLFHTLHVRAHYPESEVSVHDVSAFKSFVKDNLQPAVSEEFETRSKTYFHGRAFMVRNADFFNIPPRADVCDDTYMPNLIHTEYGPGTIRTRYDALSFYKPYLSLREHFKIYRRIFLDLRHLDRTNEQFKSSREMEQTKLDWQHIFSQGVPTILKFVAYATITGCEDLCYRVLPKKGLADMWLYKKK